MKRLLLLLACAWLWPSIASAACSGSGVTWSCTAGSTSANIQSAITSASDGATITLAAGSYTRSAALTFSTSKAVTLICASVGGCTIGGTSPLWQPANAGTFTKTIRVSGMVFTGVGSSFIWAYSTGASTTKIDSFRFDHNALTVANNGSDIITFGETSSAGSEYIYGVFDHNTFTTTTGNTRWFVHYAQQGSTPAWPTNRAGSASNLFIEDNTFTDQCTTNAGNAALDTDGGPYTWVVRYNAFTNARVEHHGYYMGFSGPASSEVYGNTFTWTCGADTIDGTYSIKHQGSGEWYVFDNTVTPGSGKGTPHILQNYRSFYDTGNNCDGTKAEDGNRLPLATYRGYPCNRQPGRDGTGVLKPQYYWNNKWSDNTAISMSLNCPDQGVANYCSLHVIANRDYYQGGVTAQTSASSPFNGTSGMGFGTLARRPTTCTPTSEAADAGNGGVGYWATDVGVWNRTRSGASGVLYRCSATNTWTSDYKPAPYPHPLQGAGGVPVSPTNARVQ